MTNPSRVYLGVERRGKTDRPIQMNTSKTDCENGEHLVVPDYFALLRAGARAVPGDVYCVNCKDPLPYWWAKPLIPAETQPRRARH